MKKGVGRRGRGEGKIGSGGKHSCILRRSRLTKHHLSQLPHTTMWLTTKFRGVCYLKSLKRLFFSFYYGIFWVYLFVLCIRNAIFIFLKYSFSTKQAEQWELPHAIPFPSGTLEGLTVHQVLLPEECQCLWWAPAHQVLSWGLTLTHTDHKPPNKTEKVSFLTTIPIRIWADVVLFSVSSWHISHMNHSAWPLLPSHTVPHTLGQPCSTSGLSTPSLMFHSNLYGPQAPSSSPIFKS